MAAETTLWTFSTRDRVASIQAVDIDADGDREILIGSQDGYVRALTRWGTPKWERFLEGHAISEKLIVYCNKQKKSYLTINDVNTVLDVILDEQISSIQWIWKQADSVERLLLSILAQEKGQERRIFTLNDIHETYDTLSIPYVGKTAKEALQNLIREDIVEESFNSTHYRIAIGS